MESDKTSGGGGATARRRRLDSEVRNQMLHEVQAWIEAVVGEPIAGASLQEGLRDGMVLCKLINTILPGAAPRVHLSSNNAFKQMENISSFLAGCVRLGMSQRDLFLASDLYEGRNMPRVLQSMQTLAEHASRQPGQFPVFRPRSNSGAGSSGGGRRLTHDGSRTRLFAFDNREAVDINGGASAGDGLSKGPLGKHSGTSAYRSSCSGPCGSRGHGGGAIAFWSKPSAGDGESGNGESGSGCNVGERLSFARPSAGMGGSSFGGLCGHSQLGESAGRRGTMLSSIVSPHSSVDQRHAEPQSPPPPPPGCSMAPGGGMGFGSGAGMGGSGSAAPGLYPRLLRSAAHAHSLSAGSGGAIAEMAQRALSIGQLERLLACAAECCQAEDWRAQDSDSDSASASAQQLLTAESLSLADVKRHLEASASTPQNPQKQQKQMPTLSAAELLSTGPCTPQWLVLSAPSTPLAAIVRAVRQQAFDRQTGEGVSLWLALLAQREAEGATAAEQTQAQLALERALEGALGVLVVLSPDFLSTSATSTTAAAASSGAAASAAASATSEPRQPHHAHLAAALALVRPAGEPQLLIDWYAAADGGSGGGSGSGSGGSNGGAQCCGLTDGPSASDENKYGPEYGSHAQGERQALFPLRLAHRALELRAISMEPAALFETELVARLACCVLSLLLPEAEGETEAQAAAADELIGGYCAGLVKSRLRRLRVHCGDKPPSSRCELLALSLPPGLEEASFEALLAEPMAASLADMLARSSSLRLLSLRECDLRPSGTFSLSQGLQRNGSLTALDLSKNKLGDPGSRSLADALLANRALVLRSLDVSSNKIAQAGAGALGELAAGCTALASVNALHNSFDAEAGALLVRACEGTSGRLRSLCGLAEDSACAYLSDVGLGNVDLLLLAHDLANSRSIRDVDLRYNKVGDAGAIALSVGIRRNASLRSLDLCRNKVGDAGLVDLASALRGHPTLAMLDLQFNEVGDAGALALADVLSDSPSLTALYLYKNQISDVGARALGAAIGRSAGTLQVLWLGGNALTEEGKRVIQASWATASTARVGGRAGRRSSGLVM